jgi:hypothetical protein
VSFAERLDALEARVDAFERRLDARDGDQDREHRLDREVVVAVHRGERARLGQGYRFKPPKGAA